MIHLDPSVKISRLNKIRLPALILYSGSPWRQQISLLLSFPWISRWQSNKNELSKKYFYSEQGRNAVGFTSTCTAISLNLVWVHYVFSNKILKVSRQSGSYAAEPTVQAHVVKPRNLDKTVQKMTRDLLTIGCRELQTSASPILDGEHDRLAATKLNFLWLVQPWLLLTASEIILSILGQLKDWFEEILLQYCRQKTPTHVEIIQKLPPC